MNNNCQKFDCLLMWVVSFLNWFHKTCAEIWHCRESFPVLTLTSVTILSGLGGGGNCTESYKGQGHHPNIYSNQCAMEITSEEKYDIAISRAQYRYQKNILIKNAFVGCKVLLKLRNLNPSLSGGTHDSTRDWNKFYLFDLKGKSSRKFYCY